MLPPDTSAPATADVDQVPEERIFDKADQAEELERLQVERAGIETTIGELEGQLKSVDGDERSDLEREIAGLQRRCDEISEALESAKGEE